MIIGSRFKSIHFIAWRLSLLACMCMVCVLYHNFYLFLFLFSLYRFYRHTHIGLFQFSRCPILFFHSKGCLLSCVQKCKNIHFSLSLLFYIFVSICCHHRAGPSLPLLWLSPFLLAQIIILWFDFYVLDCETVVHVLSSHQIEQRSVEHEENKVITKTTTTATAWPLSFCYYYW